MTSLVVAWFSWRASLAATIAGALAGVVLLAVVAGGHGGGLGGETLFFMIAIAAPVALVVAAPVGFVILPLARLALDRFAVYTLPRLLMVGAGAGFALPLAVAVWLRARVVTESWALAALFVVAATVAGAFAALIYHWRAPERPAV